MTRPATSVLKVLLALGVVCSLAACSRLLSDEQHRQIEDARTRETDSAIAGSTTLQNLQQACQDLPLFADFAFQTKRLSLGSKVFLGYGYRSSASYGEVKAFYQSHFESKKWRVEEDSSGLKTQFISFVGPDIRVTINSGNTSPRENFVIECEIR
jgi:hypothetical protein